MSRRETAFGASRGFEVVRIHSGSCKGEIIVDFAGGVRYSA